jgi:hypothetical protein
MKVKIEEKFINITLASFNSMDNLKLCPRIREKFHLGPSEHSEKRKGIFVSAFLCIYILFFFVQAPAVDNGGLTVTWST